MLKKHVIKKSFYCAVILLNIVCRDGNASLQKEASQQKSAGFSAPEDFHGESLLYDMSFWFFLNAAKGRITCTKNEKGYVAVLEAETCGITKLITGHKKEVMTSVMEYDKDKGRFRPLMFQEVFSQGNDIRKKTVSFDYEKAIFTVLRERTNRKTIKLKRKLPKKEFDDLLTFFYNFRMGYYGEVNEGKVFSIDVLVTTRLSRISIVVNDKSKIKNVAGKHHATVSMERNISEARSKIISGWFSGEFIPVQCIVEDAFFFGDIKVKLKEKKRISTNFIID